MQKCECKIPKPMIKKTVYPHHKDSPHNSYSSYSLLCERGGAVLGEYHGDAPIQAILQNPKLRHIGKIYLEEEAV